MKRVMASVALAASIVGIATDADARTYPHVHVRQLGHHAHNLPACRTESSNGCVWDAKHRGNGKGESFFVTRAGRVVPINGDGDVKVSKITYRITYK